MTTYLTADTHFGHATMLRHRGFASVNEMDAALVAAWNNAVNHGDTVWVLGDFSIGKDNAGIRQLFDALHGTKYLVLGNHDVADDGSVKDSIDALPWAFIGHYAEIEHAGQRSNSPTTQGLPGTQITLEHTRRSVTVTAGCSACPVPWMSAWTHRGSGLSASMSS